MELPSEWEVQSSVVELKPVGAGNFEWARVLALMKTTLPNVSRSCTSRLFRKVIVGLFGTGNASQSGTCSESMALGTVRSPQGEDGTKKQRSCE